MEEYRQNLLKTRELYNHLTNLDFEEKVLAEEKKTCSGVFKKKNKIE